MMIKGGESLFTDRAPEDSFVVTPMGALNRGASSCLRQELQLLIRRGAVRLVVDLSAVDSVDASCLGALLACRQEAREWGGDLVITRPNQQVSSMLRMANLDQVLPCCENAESAFS